MISEPLQVGDSLKLWPETLLGIRLGPGWMEIVTTEDIVLAAGQRMEYLLRPVLHGHLTHLREELHMEPFGCVVEQVSTSHSQRRHQTPLRFPDSCALPAAWICLQGIRFADYLPIASLRFIGAVHGGFLLGFAHTSFKVSAVNGEAGDLRRALMEDFGNGCRHLTAWPPVAYLPHPGSHRLQVSDLEETLHRPDTWDTLDTVKDLRAQPQQRAFMARLPKPASPSIDIDR